MAKTVKKPATRAKTTTPKQVVEKNKQDTEIVNNIENDTIVVATEPEPQPIPINVIVEPTVEKTPVAEKIQEKQPEKKKNKNYFAKIVDFWHF